jgi:hypothetical protein
VDIKMQDSNPYLITVNGTVGKCVLCKQWKPEVDAWQHICNDCVDKCGWI